MFGPQIREQPTDDKRRNEIRALLIGEIRSGRFFLTPILMEDEPFRTLGLEVLDGVVVESGRPQYGAAPALAADLPPTRLITIMHQAGAPAYDPKGLITVRRVRQEVVPGTSITRAVKFDEPHGHDATLTHKDARAVLVARGWPIRDHKSRGNVLGTVVEWAWLQAEAKLPTATIELRALCDNIRQAIEPAPTASPAQPKTREQRA